MDKKARKILVDPKYLKLFVSEDETMKAQAALCRSLPITALIRLERSLSNCSCDSEEDLYDAALDELIKRKVVFYTDGKPIVYNQAAPDQKPKDGCDMTIRERLIDDLIEWDSVFGKGAQ